MKKTILITGATDGIGLETARKLSGLGHNLLIHGRNASKLDAAKNSLISQSGAGDVEIYKADLSSLAVVAELAEAINSNHDKIDVLINNAGVLKTSSPMTPDGLDVRFAVNTVAPYLLTQRLLPLIGTGGRVINLSSAAQASVDLNALAGKANQADMEAYAQSKLAITMWTRTLASQPGSPIMIAVNPGSLLGTNMVREGFGTQGKDVNIGVNILCKAALDDAFSNASGQYFDNDIGQFSSPHPDALDEAKCQKTVDAIESIIAKY